MNSKILILLFVLLGSSLFAQGRLIKTGEVPGYITLTCDFHSHTVFSDGEVWPTFRVREAIHDGLDALAITDHLEYVPHKDYVRADDNSSFAIAKKNAERNGLILIRGTEVTRKMPPGHLNLLFLPDSTTFEDTTLLEVIRKAVGEGAFIQWNHPGWVAQQPDGVARMLDIHRELIKKGWLHGIEIYNDEVFYPGVMEWCLINNLAMTGNTDIHGTTEEVLSSSGDSHRVMTLVFARERNEKELKEALFLGRTLVWYGDTLAGRVEFAEPFVLSCLKRSGPFYEDDTWFYYKIENTSDIPYSLTVGQNPDAPGRIELPGRSYQVIKIKKTGSQTLHYTVANVKTGTLERLAVEF
ncbi:MAG: hypothetical protein JXA23_01100 [Bacteroidales bacterium]|nr:hypothetical protein [Bacteroidales bacterium]